MSQGQPYQAESGVYWIDEVYRVNSALEIGQAARAIEQAQTSNNWEMRTNYRVYKDQNGQLYYAKKVTRRIEHP
jgi:hypothetical protein